MRQAKHGARPFRKHVGIEIVRPQQRGTPLQDFPFGGDAINGPPRVLNLLGQFEPGEDTPLPLNGVIGEIAEDTGAENRTGTVARALADFAQQNHGDEGITGDSAASTEKTLLKLESIWHCCRHSLDFLDFLVVNVRRLDQLWVGLRSSAATISSGPGRCTGRVLALHGSRRIRRRKRQHTTAPRPAKTHYETRKRRSWRWWIAGECIASIENLQ